MTTENYSIKPLPSRELVKKWIEDWAGAQMKGIPSEECMEIAAQAAQWGFNQRGAVNEAELQKARDEELEACCKVLDKELGVELYSVGGSSFLRAARRPKPKSQAEEAIAELDGIATCFLAGFGGDLKCGNIRAALERLRELENDK